MEDNQQFLQTDDLQLLQDIKNGEAQAFQGLYDSYYPAFEKYVLTQSGGKQDARDIFQEALYTSWLKVRTDQYVHTGAAKFSSYVFEIAKRKWWNLARTVHMNKVAHTDDYEALDRHVISEEVNKNEAQVELLNNIIATLDKNCQEILRQFYYRQMTYDEMAVELGKTSKTLKNQKFRCIGRLREKYLEALKNGNVG